MKRLWEDDELAAEWTLDPNDQALLWHKNQMLSITSIDEWTVLLDGRR